jgi:hypothetical protein
MPARLTKRLSAAAWRTAHIARVTHRRAARSLRHHVARTRARAAQLSHDIAIRWTGSVRAWILSLGYGRLRSTLRASLAHHARLLPVRALRHPRRSPRVRVARTPRRHAAPSGWWSANFSHPVLPNIS